VAGAVALPVNRWLIGRGRGHAVVHETGHHSAFPLGPALAVTAAAAVFGTTVLVAQVL